MADRDQEPTSSAPGVLLDRDGTLIEDCHFLDHQDKMTFIDGAVDACRSLQRAGYRLVVVTNQSGVARGLFSRERLERIHRTLRTRLIEQGVELDGILYCPHHPDGVIPRYAGACRCRKPAPGLVETALEEFALDPRASFIVGDSPRDLACARAWPIRGILVLTGHGHEALTQPELKLCPPDHVAADLAAAARWILETGTDSPATDG